MVLLAGSFFGCQFSVTSFFSLFLSFTMKQAEMTKKGLLSRPLDLIYFVYFASHIPVTLAIDLQTLLPAHWIPKALANTLSFYKNTFKDPFMGSAEPLYWFRSFLVCELILQLPFFFYACYGLVKGKY